MPVVINDAIAGALVVAAIDTNFEEVQNFLRERVFGTDLADKIERIHIKRYSNGRLVGSSLGGIRPIMGNDEFSKGVFELNVQQQSQNTVLGRVDERPQQLMEFLGTPGKTPWFQFQEDGLSDPNTVGGIAGWVGNAEGQPTAGNYGKFPDDEAWSFWLTVPHGALKVPVVEPCVVRVSAMVTCQIQFSPIEAAIRETNGTPWPGADTFPVSPGTTPEAAAVWASDGPSSRFGLFVDSNPGIVSGQFLNSNPRYMIRQGGGWVTASNVSWKMLTDKGVNPCLRMTDQFVHEVALKPGRYNFSLKHRDGNTHGWVDRSAAPAFVTTDWEDVYAPAGYRLVLGRGPFGSPPFVCYWEHSSINVEILYNRSAAFVNDSTAVDITTGPTPA